MECLIIRFAYVRGGRGVGLKYTLYIWRKSIWVALKLPVSNYVLVCDCFRVIEVQNVCIVIKVIFRSKFKKKTSTCGCRSFSLKFVTDELGQ